MVYLGVQRTIPREAEGGEQGEGGIAGKERGKEFQIEEMGA